MENYCGQLEYDSIPLTIKMKNTKRIYGTQNLFCSWTINLNDPFKFVIVDYSDKVSKKNKI